MTRGETAVTRMPREAYSTASDLVAAARPPLVSAARTAGVPRAFARPGPAPARAAGLLG
jgi:hypothetical protein